MKTFLTFLLLLTAWPASAVNLIRNSSFEAGARSWNWGNSGDAVGTFVHYALTTTNSPYHGSNHFRAEFTGLTGDLKHNEIASDYYRLKPSTTYTLTFYFKNNTGAYGPNAYAKQTFGLQDNLYQPAGTTSWARYTNTFTTFSTNAFYQIVFNPAGQSSPGAWGFWDAVQLEEGSTATAYAPPPIEFGFQHNDTNAANVFRSTDTPKLPVITFNNTANSSNVVISYEVYNAYAVRVKTNALSFTAPAGKSTNWLDISLTTNQMGSFRTTAWIAGQAASLTEEVSSTVFPKAGLSAANSRFGTHPTFYTDYLHPISELGFAWARTLSPDTVLRWHYAEATSNVFVFDNARYQRATNEGLTILASMGAEVVHTPAWALDVGGMPKIQDWKYFLTNMVPQYTNVISNWEIWNEPEGEGGLGVDQTNILLYAQILTNASAIIKSYQPSANIVAMVTAWTNYMMDVDVKLPDRTSYDTVATHIYPDVGDEFASRMEIYAPTLGKPFWNTETGARRDTFFQSIWWEHYFLAEDPAGQRDYSFKGVQAVRGFVKTSYKEITKYFFYDARTTGNYTDPITYGPFDVNGSINPNAVQFSTLMHFADGSANGNKQVLTANTMGRIYGMRDGTNSLLVITGEGGDSDPAYGVKYWLSTTLTNYAIFDAYGNRLTTNGGAGFSSMSGLFLVATNTGTNYLESNISAAVITDTNAPALAFTLFPTHSTNEGGWVRFYAQDDVAWMPRAVAGNSANEMRYAWNSGSGWSAWAITNAVNVASGTVTLLAAAKDKVGNAVTNTLYLGGAGVPPASGGGIIYIRDLTVIQ